LLQTASSVKQSKPTPNVLPSTSFHIAISHAGGVIFVKVMLFPSVVMLVSSSSIKAVWSSKEVGRPPARPWIGNVPAPPPEWATVAWGKVLLGGS